jgi:hypothetical protein
MTNDKLLAETGATLGIVHHKSNSKPSDPLLRGGNTLPIPSLGFITKAVQFQGKLFTLRFLQATVAGSILVIDFLQRF